MDESKALSSDLVHLSRLALTGRGQDVQLYIRRMARKYRETLPELSGHLTTLLRESPTRSTPLRKEADAPIPVDLDSRLQLLRVEHVSELEVAPVFREGVKRALKQIVEERSQASLLAKEGLHPTRTALFVGPPGVGKTLAARWLAHEISVPLLILDLSAVMSSFLGRTGNNLRFVLDYAKGVDCILLLDELDAIAKRRDDTTEIGELKRLVAVLLQEIDDWPTGRLLIAATNHPDLLDPAVWRRFETTINFPMPDEAEIADAVRRFLPSSDADEQPWATLLPLALRGRSFSDIERDVLSLRRRVALSGGPFNEAVLEYFQNHIDSLAKKERALLAQELTRSGSLSQRQAHELTGVSRDTIRKALKDSPEDRHA